MKQEELEFYIDAYGKDLFSFCCCVTRNRQEADDLYQDTFLKVYELGEKLVITTNPKSYLMGIALNLYRNYKRKLSVRQRIAGVSVSLDETAELIPMEGPLTEEVMIVREECRIVREAVRKLPDKYRIPILLFFGLLTVENLLRTDFLIKTKTIPLQKQWDHLFLYYQSV